MNAHTLLRIFLCCLLTCIATLAHARSIPIKMSFGQSDAGIVSALRILIPDGYHAYSNETVATGRPTELDMRLDGQTVETIYYPRGAAQRDIFYPEDSVFVYEGETYLFANLSPDGAGKRYTAQLSLLLCSRRNCIPINQEFSGSVPRSVPALSTQPWQDIYRQTVADTKDNPKPLPPQVVPKPKEDLPPLPPLFSTQLTPEYASSFLEITSFSRAILFGILAGLLLNIMPCVLPVLTFKISGLLVIGSMSQEKRIQIFRRHNAFFAAGIICFFTLLAAILGFADMIWGQLFQSETIILIMLIVVFGMALSLINVFSLPVIDLKITGKSKNPNIQAFITGFLTTFLATPCSGPLLGGVLGWAFTQPFIILMCIFWSIGLGMALPYIVFTIAPSAVHIIPKPGAWMNVVEHVAGFFLVGTALYLLSILPEEKYIHILSVLLLISAIAWFWGQYCGPDAPKMRRRISGLICLLLLAGSIHWALKPVKEPLAWQNFTPEYFARNLGERILLIEFTADWCPNCKLMEKTVLTDQTLQDLLDKEKFDFVRADLTQANAAATYLLTELGSHSIPLTAIFPKGPNAKSPIVIRDVFTTEVLYKSFERAVSKSE
ncbi:MAG: thioredoxin family protein [Desulfovibrionaceae bacterium]|nr:thioredoxin family protein [Desulfovibrionaceae bacterium]